jgi:hypothetical protein
MMIVAEYTCVSLDLLLPVAGAGVAGYKMTRQISKRWEAYFLSSLSIFLFAVLTNAYLLWLGRHFTYRVDLFAYKFDAALGNPSFLLGRAMQRHLWLNLAARSGYSILFAALMVLLSAYFLFRPLAEAITVVRTLYTTLIGTLISIAIPISGPGYAFKKFPNEAPAIIPHAIRLTAPPNGFPSLHLTMALLILYFASRWKTGTILASLYAVLVVISTLGTGEHYLLDLIAAVPFTALVIYLGGVRTEGPKLPLKARVL